jgi:TPP-dependent indolepyruvate ferredoxin oxidoreductase alpha subunit
VLVGRPPRLCDACPHDDAYAAIREVAAWLREQRDGDLVAATVLEREAGR